MASNLSQLFKEIIASTLETNLSKTVKVQNTIQADILHIKDLNLVALDLAFDFEKVSIVTKFLVPAYLSTYIFNAMMMEDNEPSLELEDDTPDAIKEVFSQVSGSLETAINGSEFEDLGSTKQQTIEKFEVIKGEDYSIKHKLIEFTVEIDEAPFYLYVDFEEAGLEYLEDINNSAIKEIVEEPEETQENTQDDEIEETSDEDSDEESEQQEDIDEKTEESNENANEETKSENSKENDTPKDDNSDENKEEEILSDDEKKQKKLKLLVMIVAGVLVSVILTFAVLFFMGTFDPPPVVVKDANKTVVVSQEDLLILDIKNKEINFKMKMINSKRLNRRLAILTKYQILEEDVLEKFRKQEKERLHKVKMKRLEEFANNNKEESVFKNDINSKQSSNNKNRFASDESNSNNPNKDIIDSEKLTFIQISPLKYKTYKSIINKEKTKNIQVSICQNTKGKVDVYIGPIYLNMIVNNIIKKVSKVSKNDAKIVIITRKEFNKRCDF